MVVSLVPISVIPPARVAIVGNPEVISSNIDNGHGSLYVDGIMPTSAILCYLYNSSLLTYPVNITRLECFLTNSSISRA